MSNEQAPDSCPFCGAAFKGSTEDGVDREYRCGTWVASEILSPQRTLRCITAERERLTRELNDANAQLKNDAGVIVKMGKQIDRMEQAGNCLLIDNKSDANVTAWNKAKEFQP